MKESTKHDLIDLGQNALLGIVMTVVILAHHGKLGGSKFESIKKDKTENVAADSLRGFQSDSARIHMARMPNSHTR